MAARAPTRRSKLKTRPRNHERPLSKKSLPKSVDELALDALARLPEQVFTRRIVIPLLRALDPESRIEETHGPTEAGRDVIQYTTHSHLGAPIIRCVQVKSHRISTGSTSGPYSMNSVLNQVQTAKRTGVCLTNGTLEKADEVWVVNSHSMSDAQRRLVQNALDDIKASGGRYLDGIDTLGLIKKRHPDLLRELKILGSPSLVRIISAFSIHQESRAFGLRTDRALSDFHVAARACPATGAAISLLQGELIFEDHFTNHGWTCSGKEIDRTRDGGRGFVPSDFEKLPLLESMAKSTKELSIPVTWVRSIVSRESLVEIVTKYTLPPSERRGPATSITVKRLTRQSKAGVVDGGLQKSGSGFQSEDLEWSKDLATARRRVGTRASLASWTIVKVRTLARNHDSCVATREYRFGLVETSQKLHRELSAGLKSLPEDLSMAPQRVAEVAHLVLRAEKFVAQCEDWDVVRRRPIAQEVSTPDIRVTDERQLLKVGTRILIEGPPGSGKTTLLRRLAVAQLSAGSPVLFLSCANLRKEHASLSINQLLQRFVAKDTPSSWTVSGSMVLVDGLDEAPFDMGEKLLALSEKTPHVFATTRLAHVTSLRRSYARLEVSPFSDEDRDNFFKGWFRTSPDKMKQAASLFDQFKDVREHARSPLIATLLAALIERNYAPSSRNAVYDNRLSLLIEEWDSAKGVDRRKAPPSLCHRFLRELAYRVHSAAGRQATFGVAEMRDAFAEGLGRASCAIAFDDLVQDLVVNMGVLVRDGDSFAFGHLTFQEHLVGMYLYEQVSPLRVSSYLGRDWWREPLLFYAGAKKDVTELVLACENIAGRTSANAAQLLDLVNCAPYTQDVAVQMIRNSRGRWPKNSDVGRMRRQPAVEDAETLDDEVFENTSDADGGDDTDEPNVGEDANDDDVDAM